MPASGAAGRPGGLSGPRRHPGLAGALPACHPLHGARVGPGHVHYNMTPKFHALWHMVEGAACCNPFRLRAYIHESLIGTVARLYGKSMTGMWHGMPPQVSGCEWLGWMEGHCRPLGWVSTGWRGGSARVPRGQVPLAARPGSGGGGRGDIMWRASGAKECAGGCAPQVHSRTEPPGGRGARLTCDGASAGTGCLAARPHGAPRGGGETTRGWWQPWGTSCIWQSIANPHVPHPIHTLYSRSTRSTASI